MTVVWVSQRTLHESIIKYGGTPGHPKQTDNEHMKDAIQVEFESRKMAMRFAAGILPHGRRPVDKRF